MMIIGVDYHPSFQEIAFLVEETGEYGEQKLNHSEGEAERFYRDLHARGIHVQVGMEATGFSRWFERLLAELDFELWMGDPAEIKAKRVKKQKYDREDARLLLRLMRENNFPKIWVPSPENRDLRQARKRSDVLRLMTHPGVGALTALAFVLIIGTTERFERGKQIGTYVGMIPSEDSSAGKQRLGHISKQGNSLLRFLLVEAAQAAARINPHWRRRYMHLAMRRHKSIAKVAMGRRLGVRLYWMWRNGCDYSSSLEFGSYVGQLGTGHGVK